MTNKGKKRAMPEPGDKGTAYYHLATHKYLSSAAKTVGAIIVDHFNANTGQCDPGINTIARRAQSHRSTVFKSIKELEKHELIVRSTHGGKFNRNSYSINWSRMSWSQKRDVSGRNPATTNGRKAATQILKEPEKIKTEGLAKESRGELRRQRSILFPIQGGKSSTPSRSSVAQSQALLRWETELRDLLGPQYETAVGLITEALMNDATEQEMRKRGSGVSYVLAALCWGTTSPPSLRLHAGG